MGSKLQITSLFLRNSANLRKRCPSTHLLRSLLLLLLAALRNVLYTPLLQDWGGGINASVSQGQSESAASSFCLIGGVIC
jgi:hypothetical protein